MSRKGQKKGAGKKEKYFMPHDIYEDDDDERGEKFNQKFSHVGTVNIGLAADFEDESIDEDEAFTAEDYERFGDLNFGQNKRKVCWHWVTLRIPHKSTITHTLHGFFVSEMSRHCHSLTLNWFPFLAWCLRVKRRGIRWWRRWRWWWDLPKPLWSPFWRP